MVDLKDLLVIWDRGHGCYPDTGASEYIAEETIINQVSDLAIAKLRKLGVKVIEVRPGSAFSVTDSLNKRCTVANQYANAAPRVIFISEHANAGRGTGAEVYTYGGKKLTEAARYLQYLISHGFHVHASNRLDVNAGIKDGSTFAVINGTNMEAMLIENCFVDNQADVDFYKTNVEMFANAAVYGITGVDLARTIPVEEGKFLINLYGHVQNVGDMRASGVNYCEIGTTGRGLDLEALGANVMGQNIGDVEFTYGVHQENVGDVEGAIEGQILGSSGANTQLEGFWAKVRKIPTGYKLQYQVHKAGIGWPKDNEWTDAGNYAGSKGEHRAIEALRLRVVKC